MSDKDFDWAAMADLLELEGETHSPYVRQAFEELGHLTPRRILDIGSGPGVAACRLAARFPQAEVTAVDGSPELLARAGERAERLGVRLRTQVAEFPEGLADVGTADLVWSGQVVHHVGDQQGALDRLAGLLEPGGVLAIVEGGLPARQLPRDLGFGRPGLQVRLDAAMAERYNRMRDELPGSVAVVEDWPGMLRAAGLTGVRSRTFLVDHPAPLAEGPRRAVRSTLERHRKVLDGLLDAEDLATLDRLLDPADPGGVDRRADLFLLTAKTVHFGQRA
ncbi:class I SAM-dependent methyltransferase [Streptomyces netropsis]|uniref:SAM-dependent methyltransferase n=1 Tax=Streptomyces netropsis TaxID=55404 RepID=A0A7W7LIB4_STRNE|nr:class I SAM-dependent methyltransferase [Streptomyces netropsis]MBB4890798.1 SAM-dependent methyltransferase [Streptomyces netropsis]GGR51643.1 SAM-dependent methyltransferase [Streptomyces netropsis]